MFELRNDVVFNRALLDDSPLDSSALAVRGTLLHVFKDAGNHEVTILRDGRDVGRITVDAVAGGGPAQVNLELTSLEGADRLANRHAVRAGGVVGFHVGQGSGRYAIVANHTEGTVSRTVLDSREGLPVGDLFGVTPIRPGAYRARNQHNQTSLEFLVRLPRQGEPYSPARATLIETGEQSFDPPSARILAGQSLVFLARTPARLVVEPISARRPARRRGRGHAIRCRHAPGDRPLQRRLRRPALHPSAAGGAIADRQGRRLRPGAHR